MTREKLRQDAKNFFQAGIRAIAPKAAVLAALHRRKPSLPAPSEGRIFLVAIGKAARAMMEGAREYLGEIGHGEAHSCLLVADHGNFAPMQGCEAYAAGHPLPDADGLRAAKRLIALLDEMDKEDLALVLVSGGGSALLPCPPQGISLKDEIALHRLLLASGVAIDENNLLRQQFSRIKGGGLARLAHPARLLALLLSDVPGDDVRVIASGPTAAPLGSPAEAMKLAQTKGIWEKIPAVMRTHLQARRHEPAPPAPENAENVLVGSNGMMVAATGAAAETAGYGMEVVAGWMAGEVGTLAEKMEARSRGLGAPSRARGWCCGGESVVRVSGTGRGGRNQELALRFALCAAAHGGLAAPWVFLSGGSDGRDGPTDAAGGLVDGGSLERMAAAGIAPETLLANNDSHRALEASGDLLRTGATGTNVADAQIFLTAPA